MNTQEEVMKGTEQIEDEVVSADSSRMHAKNVRDVPTVTDMNILLMLIVEACLLHGFLQEHIPTILYSPHFYAGVSLSCLFVFLKNNGGGKAWYKQFSPHIKIAAVGLIVLALMKGIPRETGYALLYFFLMEVSTEGRVPVFSLLFLTAVLPLLFIDGYRLLPFPEILVGACMLALAIRIFEEHSASRLFMHMCTCICMVFVFLAALYSIAMYMVISKQGILVRLRKWATFPVLHWADVEREIRLADERMRAKADAWAASNGVFRWARNWSERLISILSFP
jgi:hypothetical protein